MTSHPAAEPSTGDRENMDNLNQIKPRPIKIDENSISKPREVDYDDAIDSKSMSEYKQ